MAVVAEYIGEFRKGDWVEIPIDTADGGWVPTLYDVIECSSGSEVLEEQVIGSDTDDPGFIKFVRFHLADVFNTDGVRQHTWREGRTYAVRIKSTGGAPPTDGEGQVVSFRVKAEDRRAFLGFVEKGKILHFMHREEDRDQMWFDVIDSKDDAEILGNIEMTKTDFGNNNFKGSIDSEGTDDLAIGQTYWVRVKDVRADDPNLSALYSFTVLPRLELSLIKLLGLAGENLVHDNFSYDDTGNIIGLRVRVFATPEEAQAATLGVTDPEPGEVCAYDVSQEHDQVQNLRTFHQSVLEYENPEYPIIK